MRHRFPTGTEAPGKAQRARLCKTGGQETMCPTSDGQATRCRCVWSRRGTQVSPSPVLTHPSHPLSVHCPSRSKLKEPRAGSKCLNTEQSICKKTCDASKSDGSGDSVSCTGFCRCEPECGGQCETTCCRLAFELKPPGCKVLRYDCDFRQTILERSECNATSHLCTCAAGHCGYNVSQDGHMVCAEGFGAPCMPCPPGSYKPSLSLAACSPCSQGYSTRTAGAIRREDCEPLCKNGSSSATGFEVIGIMYSCFSELLMSA